MIKKVSISLLALGIMISLWACGPKEQRTADESKLCVPHSLYIDSTGNHYVRIAWNPGCRGTRIMRGFNIYYSPTPLASKYPGHELPDNIRPYNKEIYPGDPEGNADKETFEFKNIPSNQLFYVHVRVVNTDKSLSVPSNEIEMVCYPQGTIELATSYTGNHSGYSFVNDSYCATDAIVNDLYFFSKNGKDYLCSPGRISDVHRANKIYVLGKAKSLGNTDDIHPAGEPSEKVVLIPGMVYVIETPDNYFAKLRLVKMKGSGKDRKAVFEFFYRGEVIRQYKGA